MTARGERPWWLRRGREMCSACERGVASEAVLHCSACDRPVCGECVLVDAVAGELLCRECRDSEEGER